MAFISLLLLFLSFISTSTACDRCVHHSKAAYFATSSAALSAGSCGYGPIALTLNGRYVVAASPSLYRAGTGCGACFHIRRKDPKLCSSAGVRVVATDLNRSNRTDFLLSTPAFTAMARLGLTRQELEKLRMALEIEYKRIPCEYSRNLSVRVEEGSRIKPAGNLVIRMLYQGGQTDIVGVDVARVGESDWRSLTRRYGPVWATARAPAGALQMRVVVTGGYDGKWLWAEKEVLPAEWKAGEVYDSGLKVTEVAQEGCSLCADDEWK